MLASSVPQVMVTVWGSVKLPPLGVITGVFTFSAAVTSRETWKLWLSVPFVTVTVPLWLPTGSPSLGRTWKVAVPFSEMLEMSAGATSKYELSHVTFRSPVAWLPVFVTVTAKGDTAV